jgi:hypothetical protein
MSPSKQHYGVTYGRVGTGQFENEPEFRVLRHIDGQTLMRAAFASLIQCNFCQEKLRKDPTNSPRALRQDVVERAISVNFSQLPLGAVVSGQWQGGLLVHS